MQHFTHRTSTPVRSRDTALTILALVSGPARFSDGVHADSEGMALLFAEVDQANPLDGIADPERTIERAIADLFEEHPERFQADEAHEQKIEIIRAGSHSFFVWLNFWARAQE